MATSKKARKAAARDAQKTEPKPVSNQQRPQVRQEYLRAVPEPRNDQFLEMQLQTLQKIWIYGCRWVENVLIDLGGQEMVESGAAWCGRNPHIAICLLAASIVFLLPFLIIFGFGIATMVMTLTGLLVLEGTLLTIVSMVFFVCLGGFLLMVPIIGVAAVAAYFGFARFFGLTEGSGGILGKFIGVQRKYSVAPSPTIVTISEEPKDLAETSC